MFKYELIDTHAHIYDSKFIKDRDNIIKRALNTGIKKILMPSLNLDCIDPMLKVSDQYPNICFPMLGLHPCDVKENFRNILSKMEKFLSQRTFYAIGEIGIDLYWNKTYLKQQIEAFKIQLNWAKVYNLPIVIHSRNAFFETISVLKKIDKPIKGIFHCFDGNLNQANEIINLGMHLGIGGILTFKNSNLKDIIEKIDLKHIVLETDSPYLAPTPFRGKRNEPSYLIKIAETLSNIKKINLKETAKITTINSKKIFNLN